MKRILIQKHSHHKAVVHLGRPTGHKYEEVQAPLFHLHIVAQAVHNNL